MSKQDEDDDPDSAVGAVRYPCMPSLVALQQMRNRLHLAYLGKKLMKWTAVATGKELRRIGLNMVDIYQSFNEDIRNAFMLLARCRYFYPNLNQMVLENVPKKASIVVGSKVRTVSAVKCIKYEVIDYDVDPYEHLGIDKGGHTILETKEAWKNLLKRIILMLELRISFTQVETAHKNANKREKVLTKIVIPRLKSTIKYILLELEELAREELYRIKMVKVKKVKIPTRNLHKEPGHTCPICAKNLDSTIKEISDNEVVAVKPTPPVTPKVIEPKVIENKEIIEPKIKEIEYIPTPRAERSRIEQAPLYIPLSSGPQQAERTVDPLRFLSLGEINFEAKLDYLKNQLNDVLELSKGFIGKGFENLDIKEFLLLCDDVRRKIEDFFKIEGPNKELNDIMKSRLDHLKCHLREVIDVTREFRDESFLTPSVDEFVRTCEDVHDKLNVYMKQVESKPITETAKNRLVELKTHIQGVMKLTEDYKNEGLLTPSVEAFLKSCEVVEGKIDSYAKETVDEDKEKLEHLKGHVNDLEEIAADVKKEGIASKSLENFLSSCKDFKSKLDKYKKRGRKPPTEDSLSKLVSHLDETIELSKEAKEVGLISESVEDFIKSCEAIKLLIESKQKPIEPEPKVLDELKGNIDNVMKMISQCRIDGLITSSVEDFLKSCENTKAKIEVYERYPLDDDEGTMIYAVCSDTCICGEKDSLNEEPCEKCQEMLEDHTENEILPPPPCDFCAGIIKEPESNEMVCESSDKESVEMPEWPPYVSPEQSEENVCNFCKKPDVCEEKESKESQDEKTEEEGKEQEKEEPGPVDSSLGYFEKKVRRIMRIKRSQNRDGTIREEKETILVRKEKHDPNETTLEDDDDDEFGDVSYESMLEEDKKNIKKETKKVGLCLVPELNQLGFTKNVRRSNSELVLKSSPMFSPILIQSISTDDIRLKVNSDGAGCSKDATSSSELLHNMFVI